MRLAEADRPCRSCCSQYPGILLRNTALEQWRTAFRRNAPGVVQVLPGDWHSVERSSQPALSCPSRSRSRLFERPFRSYPDIDFISLGMLFDTVEKMPRDLCRISLATGDGAPERGGSHGGIVHENKTPFFAGNAYRLQRAQTARGKE